MNRFVFLLGFLLMALMTVTLQAQKIIPLWQNNMPNSKGIVLKDSVVRERVVQVGTYSCRKSSSGLSSPRLSGRGRLFTSKCADSFFSDI